MYESGAGLKMKSGKSGTVKELQIGARGGLFGELVSTPLPLLEGLTFSRSQIVTFRRCSPVLVMWGVQQGAQGDAFFQTMGDPTSQMPSGGLLRGRSCHGAHAVPSDACTCFFLRW